MPAFQISMAMAAVSCRSPRTLSATCCGSIRPVIVVDEGHKAYSTSAADTILGFNPRFVLELSATPKDRPKEKPPRSANWLVDVRGKQLADEEMIKLPINVKVKAGDDWRDLSAREP